MVNHHKLRSYPHTLPEPELDPEEDHEGQQPITVEAVYNYHEDGKSKTVALRISLQLSLQ